MRASSRPTNVARRTSRARRISDGSDIRSAAASSRDIRLIIHHHRSIARRRKRASAETRVASMIYLFTLVTTAVDLVALVALEATTAENASLDESAEASMMESIGRGVTIGSIGRFVSIGRFDRSFRSFRKGGKSSGWDDDVRSRGKVGCVCVNRVYYFMRRLFVVTERMALGTANN